MRPLRLLAVQTAMLDLTLPAKGWDDTGHQQIADIAWTRLNDKAKAEVTAILAAGGDRYKPITTTDASGRSSFRRSANFPDYIKGHDYGGYDIVRQVNVSESGYRKSR
jgi:hypothetical protein